MAAGAESRAAAAKLRGRLGDPALEAARQAALAAERAALAAFCAAFADTDWHAFDAEKERRLLTTGFDQLPMLALQRGDASLALRVREGAIAVLPTSPVADRARAGLVECLLELGRAPEAVARARAFAEQAGGERRRAELSVVLADALAASGAIAAARETLQRARAWAAEEQKVRDPKRTAPARRLSSRADARLALLGRRAPELAPQQWLGGPPRTLEDMRGHIVVVDFWATWCAPCRRVMPDLDALYAERGSDGVAVIGVTRPYEYGFLPAGDSGAAEQRIRDLAPEEFGDHVAQFRERFGSRYPYTIATEDDFRRWRVAAIPTVCVVDGEGTVAFVGVGASCHPYVKSAVARLVAESKRREPGEEQSAPGGKPGSERAGGESGH